MHRPLRVVSVGSVGDLGRIARRLAERGFNIEAIGGGEGTARGGSVGVVSMLVTPDDDPSAIVEALEGLELDGGRTLEDVQTYPAFDLELGNQPGQLAEAAELLGAHEINIMTILSIDVHNDWAVVCLAFEDDDAASEASERLRGAGFSVLQEHGGHRRRRRVDHKLGGAVRFRDRDEDDPDQ
jgi:hypothetical protein